MTLLRIVRNRAVTISKTSIVSTLFSPISRALHNWTNTEHAASICITNLATITACLQLLYNWISYTSVTIWECRYVSNAIEEIQVIPLSWDVGRLLWSQWSLLLAFYTNFFLSSHALTAHYELSQRPSTVLYLLRCSWILAIENYMLFIFLGAILELRL